MKYDFETLVNRKHQGSEKWEFMYALKKDVPSDIVPLSVADMEFKNPPEIIEGLKSYLDEVILGYTMPTDDFYNSVISWMKRRHNFEVKKEWIVNTSGVVPAIFNGIRKFSNEGDGVIIMSPVYYPFYDAIRLQNRKIVDCPLIEKDGYYTINYELFDKLSSDKNNKILLFCSPHNPVGRVWKREELNKLKDTIIKNDLILLSDEIHFDIIMPGYEHTVFQTIDEELSNRTITFTSQSKTFNLAGMGLSNIIIKNDELRKIFKKGLEEISHSVFTTLGYKACEIGYNKSEEWLEEFLKVIDRNQKYVNEYFKTHHKDIKANLIEGTYLQWIDFRNLGLDKNELEKFMIKNNLFLDEGYIFGDKGIGFERINLAVPFDVLKSALERLSEGLKKLK